MCCVWVLTVLAAMPSSSWMELPFFPCAIRQSTSRSRGDRPCSRATAVQRALIAEATASPESSSVPASESAAPAPDGAESARSATSEATPATAPTTGAGPEAAAATRPASPDPSFSCSTTMESASST